MIEVNNALILHLGVFPGGRPFFIRREPFDPNGRELTPFLNLCPRGALGKQSPGRD
jgi:hypothetical protein